MKKITLMITLSLFLVVSSIAQTITADKVLENHFKAIGMNMLVKHKSMKTTGKQIMQGMELPFVVYQSRPLKFRMEIEAQGMKIITALNGDKGFMVNPMTGSNDAKDLPKEQLKALKKQADMNGGLYKYKEKGLNIKLTGENDVDGKKAYKLEVSEATDAKETKEKVSDYFFDKESYMLLQISTKTEVNGQELEVNIKFSDYRKKEGVSIAFVTETFVGTMSTNKVIIDKVEFNETMPDTLFNKQE